MNAPDGPLKVSSACVWHWLASSREQCRSCDAQVSAAWPTFALALPENAIVSPTAHVVCSVGASTVTVGGTPTVTVLVAVPLRPAGLVTRRRTST